jgi:hypothetical protein
MKKDKTIIILIVIWQLFWAFVALLFLDGFIGGFVIGSQSPFYYYLKRHALLIWWVFNIFVTLLLPVSVIGCIGLIKRKNWGRVLSIAAMGITLVLIFIAVLTVIFMPDTVIINYTDVVYKTDILTEVIVPILVISIVLLASILPMIYLTRLRIKELFKRKSEQVLN